MVLPCTPERGILIAVRTEPWGCVERLAVCGIARPPKHPKAGQGRAQAGSALSTINGHYARAALDWGAKDAGAGAS